MSFVLTTDLHLDSSPDNEYRWEIFNTIERERDVTAYFILGDLADRKDNHSSTLVNRVVARLRGLAEKAPVYVLKGNHDEALPGRERPYWHFLNAVPGVVFVSDAYAVGCDLVLLAHSRQPAEDWRDIPFEHYRCAFIHQTVKGANLGGMVCEEDNMPNSLEHMIIYSGDVHIPQRVGNVIYVGAPHPVRFGDDHNCRYMVLDSQTYKTIRNVKLHPPYKRVVRITSPEELREVSVGRGDRVRIDLDIRAGDLALLPQDKEAIRQWARERGVALAGFNVSVARADKTGRAEQRLSVSDVFNAFCVHEAITGHTRDRGYALLKQRTMT